MSTGLSYARSAERPYARLWLQDDQGDLIDLSTGYTFTVNIGRRGHVADRTKTTGITGAAGAGVCPTGTPNLVVAWSAGELNLTPGAYELEIIATTGTDNQLWRTGITITDVISPGSESPTSGDPYATVTQMTALQARVAALEANWVVVVRYNGTSWPTPPTGAALRIFTSEGYPLAPDPTDGVVLGDMWLRST